MPLWTSLTLKPSKPQSLKPSNSKALNPQPSTLNPQPSTLNPQPSTLNPQPSTLNPQPSTLNPQPSTLNPQPSNSKTLNPKPSTLNPKLSEPGHRAGRTHRSRQVRELRSRRPPNWHRSSQSRWRLRWRLGGPPKLPRNRRPPRRGPVRQGASDHPNVHSLRLPTGMTCMSTIRKSGNPQPAKVKARVECKRRPFK